jgi:hypothetical protein
MLSPPPDLLAVACPGCHAALAVSSPLFGQAAACPVCGAGFLAPMPPAAPAFGRPDEPAEPRTIGHGSERIELRRLTPEEKAARRARRNLITLGLGTLFLFAIVLVATRSGKKKPKKR